MFFNALLMLVTWLQLSSINLVLLLLLIKTITYFFDGFFIVMLIFGLDLPWSLMIFWIFLIFWAWRFEKTSLILKTSLVVVVGLDTWAYNLFGAHLVILKYLEISFTSLGDLAGIRSSLLMLTSLSVLFSPFFSVLIELVLEVNLNAIFCLKELLFLSARSKS